MKKHIKLILLTVFALALFSSVYSQSSSFPSDTRKTVYMDPKIQDAIDFLTNRLPRLVVEDRAQAAAEYQTYFTELNKLDEMDVLYLVGHFYAVADDAKKAIPYFEMLINDPRLGEDSRRMLNLLLYYRSVFYLQGEDSKSKQDFLEDVLNLFPTGKYYPTYLYLWADVASLNDRHEDISNYLQNYNSNRDWIQNSFKPRKLALISRINNLNFDRFYQNPSSAEYLVSENEITGIQNDLQALYNEFKAIRGLVMVDIIDKMSADENKLLEDLKQQLKLYVNPPPLDLAALASVDYANAEKSPYDKYREGAVLLAELKGTADYYGQVIDVLDRFFDRRYELFISDDASVRGKNFSDMELKRLIDIERNIYIYTDIIKSIDALMADPAYPNRNIDLRPERQEYEEKLADLQIRKRRYLTIRKHDDATEEAVFNELLEEYYALNSERNSLNELLPQVEEVMTALIMKNYPKDMQDNIYKQRLLAGNAASKSLAANDNFNAYLTNLDFIQLELDYRNLRYRDQQRLAKTAKNELTYEESNQQLQQILTEKEALLIRHQDFVANNPGFQALEQPSGGYLINNSILFYNMAELQYAVDSDHPELALGYYRKVLQADPDFFLKDYALYNIGYLSTEAKKDEMDPQIAEFRKNNPNSSRPSALKYKESDFREALTAYREITASDKYKDSPLFDESLYRLSVLNFLLGTDADEPVAYYTEARKGFDQLINDPESKYRYEALYQRAWVNMNQGDEASLKLAMGDFTNLMTAVDEGKIESQYLAQDYKDNSIDNIAYTLIALDGVDFTAESKGTSEIQVAMAKYEDKQAKSRILEKAALHKIGMQAPLQAIDFMELRLKTAPLELTNPSIVDSIIKLYHTPGLALRQGTDLASIRNEKYQFIMDNYNNQSEWYNANIRQKNIADPALAAQLQVIRNAYEEIRIRRYNAWITKPSDETKTLYAQHMAAYSSYPELFGNDYALWQKQNERTDAELGGVIAEKLNRPEDYLAAIKGLNSYNDKYPDNPDYFNYEGLAYKYAQTAYAMMSDSLAQAAYTPAPGLPSDNEALYTFFRDASLRFYNVLQKPVANPEANLQNSAQVMMNLAEIEIGLGKKSAAKTHYKQLVEFEDRLDSTTRRSIYLALANLSEEEQNYTEAENWYRKALVYARNQQDANEIDQQIKLQIQNNYELAERGGNYPLVAAEHLRLADEYKGDRTKYSGFQYQASEAYKKAGMYQEAIDLKLDMAKSYSTMDEKYYLYYDSWTIADSLMHDEIQGKKLRQDFIAMYPASNRAFNLQVLEIDKLSKDPAQRDTAAGMYIDLHNLVRAKKIDSGTVSSADIYLWAVDLYRETNNKDKIIELLTYFTQTYPDHPQNTEFLTILADEYLARGDKDKFEQYARQIFLKDKTKSARYLTTANQKLGRIAMDFDAAYAQEDWNLAFQKRDEFKRLEAQYIREGLPMNNEAAYAVFAQAEKVNREQQAKISYLRNFDQQLNAIEQGNFLKSSPAQLILVNSNTSWQRHLFGGSANRIPAFKSTVEGQYKGILKLMDQEDAEYLDNSRRLKALDLICRVNEHAADAIRTQVNRYLEVADEMAPFKNRRQYSQAQYDELVNNELLPYAQQFIDQYNASAAEIYMQIHTNYDLAGYTDNYTNRAAERLQAMNLLPAYQTETYPLNDGWNITLAQPGGSANLYTYGITATTTPKGQKLGMVSIPAKKNLVVEREINAKVAPDFVFMHMVYPYDPEISVNGTAVEYVYVPIDTLVAKDPLTTRYAVRIDGKYWKAGSNGVKAVFPNQGVEPIALHLTTIAYFNQAKLAGSLPSETLKVSSDGSWKVITSDPQTGEPSLANASVVSNYDLPLDKTEKLVNTSAKPIWANETAELPQNEVTFEVSFNIDTPFREGFVDFVAPDYVSLYLNSSVLDTEYPLDYESDPLMVFPSRVAIPKDLVVNGQNTLRMTVQNQSRYRGMIAEINITKAAKE